jgi:outer membrane protein OmpA-like peptidoglycan-associated protein
MQPRFAALLFALGLVDLAIVNLGLGPRVFADAEAVAAPAPSSLPARVVEAPAQLPSTPQAQSPEARREPPPSSAAPHELPPAAAPSAVPLQPTEPAHAEPTPAAPAELTPAERAPALAAQWADPAPAPAAVTAGAEGTHTSTIDVTVAFPETAAALLTPEARGDLLRLAARMRDDTSHRLRIVGHADARGSREFNRFLGNRRARVVSELLVAAGVPREQIEIESRGEEQPLELGASEEAWAANRRVEISIGKEGSNTP